MKSIFWKKVSARLSDLITIDDPVSYVKQYFSVLKSSELK